MSRIALGLLLLVRAVQYKFSRTRDDFWGWLYRRAIDPQGPDYESPGIVMFLIVNAGSVGDHYRVCNTFLRFSDVTAVQLNERAMRVVLRSAIEEEYSVVEEWVRAILAALEEHSGPTPPN